MPPLRRRSFGEEQKSTWELWERESAASVSFFQRQHPAVPYTCGSFLLRGLNPGRSTFFASMAPAASSSSSTAAAPPEDKSNSGLLTTSVSIDVFPRLEAWVLLDQPFLPLPPPNHPPASLQRSLLVLGQQSSASPASTEGERTDSSRKRSQRKAPAEQPRQSHLPVSVEKRMRPSNDRKLSLVYYGAPVVSFFTSAFGDQLSSTSQKDFQVNRAEDDDYVLSLALGSALTFFTKGGPPARPAVYVQQRAAEVKKQAGLGRGDDKEESVVALLPEGESTEYLTVVCLKPGPVPARLLLRTSSIPRKGIDVYVASLSLPRLLLLGFLFFASTAYNRSQLVNLSLSLSTCVYVCVLKYTRVCSSILETEGGFLSMCSYG